MLLAAAHTLRLDPQLGKHRVVAHEFELGHGLVRVTVGVRGPLRGRITQVAAPVRLAY